VAPLAEARVPMFLSMPRARVHGDFPVRVRIVRAADGRDSVTASGTFLGPSS
jgi:hypothetical protein